MRTGARPVASGVHSADGCCGNGQKVRNHRRGRTADAGRGKEGARPNCARRRGRPPITPPMRGAVLNRTVQGFLFGSVLFFCGCAVPSTMLSTTPDDDTYRFMSSVAAAQRAESPRFVHNNFGSTMPTGRAPAGMVMRQRLPAAMSPRAPSTAPHGAASLLAPRSDATGVAANLKSPTTLRLIPAATVFYCIVVSTPATRTSLRAERHRQRTRCSPMVHGTTRGGPACLREAARRVRGAPCSRTEGGAEAAAQGR